MQVKVVRSRHDDPLARPLVEELSREYDERYGGGGAHPPSVELSRYPAERFDPANGGEFLLLLADGGDADGIPVAGGAFMRADDASVEVKRVWTSSAHRRQGLARRVMTELEAEATRRGIRRIVLTTGSKQPEAVALYLALGYTPEFDVEGDWQKVGYLPFEKTLPAPAG